MPYDVDSYPKLAWPPSPIACLPKALGLSWANYAHHFRTHLDHDSTRMEAGSVLGGAILRHYFASAAGFRRRRVYLGDGWGTPEMRVESEILEGAAVDDLVLWVVDKNRGKKGVMEDEEEVVPSVEVPDEEYNVHTLLFVITHSRFMGKKERTMPSLLPLMSPGFVVGGKEVRTANVVLLTGESATAQFEFYKLDLDSPKGRTLVPALGTKEDIFGTNAFGLETKSAEDADKMWKAAMKGGLKAKEKLKTKQAVDGTTTKGHRSLGRQYLHRRPSRSMSSKMSNVGTANDDPTGGDDTSLHLSSDMDISSLLATDTIATADYTYTVADAVKSRKRNQSSRALSIEAIDIEEAHPRGVKKQKISPKKEEKGTRKPKKHLSIASDYARSKQTAAPKVSSPLRNLAFGSTTTDRFSPESTTATPSQLPRFDTPQSEKLTLAMKRRKRRDATVDTQSSASTTGTPSAEKPRKKKQKLSALSVIDQALQSPAPTTRFGCPFHGCTMRYSKRDGVHRHFKAKHASHTLDLAAWEYTSPDGHRVDGQDVVRDAGFDEVSQAKKAAQHDGDVNTPTIGTAFHDASTGHVWEHFITGPEVSNPEQVTIDMEKDERLWYYLGAISTEGRDSYTEDLAIPRHNWRADFM